MTDNKEKIIIDLRHSTKHDLFVLAQLLLHISSLFRSHGLTVQIKKTQSHQTVQYQS